MTILHLSGEGHQAGSSISIALLARVQREAGQRAIVACPPGSFLFNRVRECGGEAVPLEFGTGASARLGELIASESVTVVNAHSSSDRALCRRMRAARRLGPALVFTRRAMPLTTLPGLIADRLLVDQVIAVSRAVARVLVRRGLPRRLVRVVHNAADRSRLAPPAPAAVEVARRRCALPGDRPVIGVVARRKDHALLLSAIRSLQRPIAVVCLGTGSAPALEAAARQAAPHIVRLLPFDPEVRPYYELFDIVALPTRSEGMSLSLLEAMTLGMPIVTTDAGGNGECVRDGIEALLVPRGDRRLLARALGALLDEPSLATRLGEAAARRAARFGTERLVADTAAAYAAAMRRREAA